MKKHIVSAAILFSCCSMVGMQEDKLASLIAWKKRLDPKDVKQCEICHKNNAWHRHPDIIGFMCADCSNENALWHLDMVLGGGDYYRRDVKK
jgi:hypothetical protein